MRADINILVPHIPLSLSWTLYPFFFFFFFFLGSQQESAGQYQGGIEGAVNHTTVRLSHQPLF